MLALRAMIGSLGIVALTAFMLGAMWSFDPFAHIGALAGSLCLLLAGGTFFFSMRSRLAKRDHRSEPETSRISGADDLVAMLRDTLLIARGSRTASHNEPVDVPTLLFEVAHKFPSVSVRVAGAPRSILVDADKRALGHAFDILIDNACANGPRAAIECDAGTALVLVHFDDSGPGIPRNLRQRVLERQYYMSTPPSQRVGCSAALVIAHQIARASGGELSAGASPLGGTRFTLSLPLLGAEIVDTATHQRATVAA